MAFTDGLARLVLGITLPMFVPGYVFIAALFPRRDSLDGLERTALSFGLSLALVPLTALALNFTPWGIGPASVAVGLTVLVLVVAALAYQRRRDLAPGDRLAVNLSAALAVLRPRLTWGTVLGVALVLSAAGSVATAGYVLLTPKPPVTFTEFYLRQVQGVIETRPIKVAPGEQVSLVLGIANYEGRETSYWVDLEAPQQEAKRFAEASVAPGQAWETKTSFALDYLGDGQKVLFKLYRQGDTQPYRTLYLWVDVRSLA